MPRRPQKTDNEIRAERQGRDIRVERLSFWQRCAAFFRDPRTHYVSGLVLLALAIFLTVAVFSFLFTGAADVSILDLPTAERVANRPAVNNVMGLFGAVLARFLLDGAFGITSLGLVLLMVLYGLRLLKLTQWPGLRLFFCTVFWVLWGSVTLGFIQLLGGWNIFFRLGGRHGEAIAAWLDSYIHPVGVSLLIIVTLAIFLVLIDPDFIRKCEDTFYALAAKFRHNPPETPEDDGNIEIPLTPDTTPENDSTDTSEKPNQVFFTIEDTTPQDDLSITVEEDEGEDHDEDTADGTDSKDNTQTDAEDTPQNADLDIAKTEVVELAEDDPKYLLQKLGPFDPRKDLENFQFPSLSLLKVYDNETAPVVNQEEQQANANRIVTTLRNYGIEIDSIKATVGPTVTLYEIVPKAGIRVSQIQRLENDIMMSLSATGIRIIAPMPGKGTVGIEVPNENPQTVSMHSVIASKRFQEEHKMRLPIAYGRTITNEVFMFDLAKTPHLLVAGATGTGKSVAINAIITSLLYKKHPAELKLVMVDPKMVEFAPYKPLLRHYLAAMPDTDPEQIVITECDRVINTLNSLVIEMENRYKLLMDAGVRNLEDYNEKFINRRLNPQKLVADSLHHQFLPYIVIIIDEYGDFIMQAGKQVETPIARITQKARAVGMHMILATQRPSVNIVTGVIKANIPTRIALRTQSVIDSRTVLDAKGAEQLIGRGDSLYAGNASVTRIQCAFVDTPEVDAIVAHIAAQQHYFEPYQLPEYVGEGGEADALAPGSVDMKRLDPMFADVARYVVTKQEGSTSRLQRAFEIGYNRAGKLSDQLEAAGIVGPNKGSKGRDVLIQDLDQLDKILNDLGCNK